MVTVTPKGQGNRAAEEPARRERLAQLVSALGKFQLSNLSVAGQSHPCTLYSPYLHPRTPHWQGAPCLCQMNLTSSTTFANYGPQPQERGTVSTDSGHGSLKRSSDKANCSGVLENHRNLPCLMQYFNTGLLRFSLLGVP